ncbi:MAG: undecaprenyl-phosphate galactose phosphotransferase WbaP [Lentisphaeria bacterium]|nr:undecaprenyl-phosphate galactose phosphotransferase WbaP [Lentisphaeria bacterium]
MKIMTHGTLRVIFLIATDFLVLYSVLAVVLLIYKFCGAEYPPTILLDIWPMPLTVFLTNIFCRLYCGSLFYPGAGCTIVEEFKRLTLSVIGGYLLLFAYLALIRMSGYYTRFGLLLAMGVTILLLPIFRAWTRSFLRSMHWGEIPVLIAGAGVTGALLKKELKRDKFFGFRFCGFLDDEAKQTDNEGNPLEILGKLEDAQKIAREKGIDYLITALPLDVAGKHLDNWLTHFQHILIIPDKRVFPILWTHPVDICGLSSIEIGNRLKRPLFRFSKTLAEILIATVAIICLFPLGLLLSLMVKCSSKGPIFYKAKRLGINGSQIEVWKFRTMYADADKKLEKMLAENPEMEKEWREKFKLENDPRITPLGKFLRKTSLDELPQFLNVLRGEMAVIGPRPIVQKEVAYYGKYYSTFSRVKPGITGLWQVSGRSETTYERRIMLDMYYINNWSIWLDYYIFLKTIKEVLVGRGAQ